MDNTPSEAPAQPGPTSQPPTKKSIRLVLVIAVIVILIAASALTFTRSYDGSKSKSDTNFSISIPGSCANPSEGYGCNATLKICPPSGVNAGNVSFTWTVTGNSTSTSVTVWGPLPTGNFVYIAPRSYNVSGNVHFEFTTSVATSDCGWYYIFNGDGLEYYPGDTVEVSGSWTD